MITMGYGFFCGGDPRKFWPDGESCSAEEIENHEASCKLWNEAEARIKAEQEAILAAELAQKAALQAKLDRARSDSKKEEIALLFFRVDLR